MLGVTYQAAIEIPWIVSLNLSVKIMLTHQTYPNSVEQKIMFIRNSILIIYMKHQKGFRVDSILRLSNAVRGLIPLVSFFEICRVKRIRIISLKDKFASWDEMFPSSISQLIDAIGAFPGDIKTSKIAAARIRAVKTIKKSSFQNSKEERENRCVSMYNNGASIKDIKEEIGFRSNSYVYRFLKNKWVQVNRRSTK